MVSGVKILKRIDIVCPAEKRSQVEMAESEEIQTEVI